MSIRLWVNPLYVFGRLLKTPMVIALSYINERIKQSVKSQEQMIATIFDVDGTLVESTNFDDVYYLSAVKAVS